ncbi:MAG: AAA family ATPase [Candidatus Hadarchaeia archaeon]
MSEFPIIGLVGPPASGKSEVASLLEIKGAERVRMGDIVWKEVEERGMELNEENVGKVANRMRQENGMDAVAKKIIPIVEERMECNPVVVDGIRGIAEVKRFRNFFGEKFVLVAVVASVKTRYDRVERRGRKDDIDDFESFKKKEEREFGWGLEKAIEASDFEVRNEGSREELRREVEEVFGEVISRHGN